LRHGLRFGPNRCRDPRFGWNWLVVSRLRGGGAGAGSLGVGGTTTDGVVVRVVLLGGW